MAPKRQPIGAKGSQVSGDQSSRPGNQSFRKKTDRPETPSTGLQGAQEKLISSRKKTMSTAEKLDLLDEEKKAKAKPKAKAAAPVFKPPAEMSLESFVDLAELAPLPDILAPVEALISRFREELVVAQKRHRELGETGRWGASSAPELPPEAAPPSIPKMGTDKAIKLWRTTAEEGLLRMGSSLAAALASEDKLRDIFDKIDLDHGGTIDKNELQVALTGAGKFLTSEEIDAMMGAADDDASGEIDFEEFAKMIRGVQKNRAATTIGRKVREAQQKQMNAKRGVADITSGAVIPKHFLDRALGDTLQQRGINVKDLVREWARKTKGEISKIEFRTGVREGLGLNFDNKALDEWFEKMDADGGGTLDEAELKAALKLLQERSESENATRQEMSALMESLTLKLGVLEGVVPIMRTAHEAAHEAIRQLNNFRALPAADAKLDEKLSWKFKSESNEGRVGDVEFEDLYKEWKRGKTEEGWIDREEFFKQCVLSLYEGLKGAKKLATAAGARLSSEEESLVSKTSLLAFNLTEEDIYAQFDMLLPEGVASSNKTAKLELRPALKAILGASAVRKKRDALLYQDACRLKNAALEQAKALTRVLSDFLEEETATR